MMEENRKGPSIFYAVVGVATLVVAIIGATFAYFSASAQVTGNENITGQTENLQNALTVAVSKVSLGTNEERGVASDHLVPSNIAGTSATNINAVLEAKCANSGYSACHVYKIDAKSTTTVTAVDLKLAKLELSETVKDTASWKYAIYRGTTDTNASEVTVAAKSFSALDEGGETFRTQGLTANEVETYYLMIFITNTENAQNIGDANDVTGSYTGEISMTAAGGGKVSATFTSQA